MLQNQSEKAYEFLRKKLLNRELLAGTRLRYGQVGREMGISATPVREAIGKLASEGLVELIPQSGALVVRPSRQDAIEVFELREAIEPFAAAKACDLVGRLQLRNLADNIDRMTGLLEKAKLGDFDRLIDTVAFDRADLQFHMTILEVADNRRMLKAVTDFHLLTAIIGFDRHDYQTNVLAMTIEDHHAILEGLNRRDSQGVIDAMVLHIRNSRQLTLSHFSERERSDMTETSREDV